VFVVFVAWQIKQIYPQHCQPAITSNQEEGYALIGTEFKTLITMTYALCLLECESDLNCMSINFHMVTKKCELNAQTKETLPEIYKQRQNSIYSTNMDNRTPSRCQYRLLLCFSAGRLNNPTVSYGRYSYYYIFVLLQNH